MSKRAFDIAVSGMLLLVLMPLMAILAMAVRLSSPGPVFYGSVRIGQGGRPFRMLKFRSMVADADRRGASSTSAGDPRVTPIGPFMRRFKLDELPQLINVLKGEMSLVGPRPQVDWAVKLYSPEEREILSVRPGITDPASLRFANEAEILRGEEDADRAYMELIHPRKMRLSLRYVRHRSFWRDLRIIACTALTAVGLVSYAVDPGKLKSATRARTRS